MGLIMNTKKADRKFSMETVISFKMSEDENVNGN